MAIFQKIITFFLWETGLSKNSRTCTKVFSTRKKIINRIAAILDFRKIAKVEKHAKNTFFEHTPWGKVKISKKAQLKLWAWSMRSQITIGPGVADQKPGTR